MCAVAFASEERIRLLQRRARRQQDLCPEGEGPDLLAPDEEEEDGAPSLDWRDLRDMGRRQGSDTPREVRQSAAYRRREAQRKHAFRAFLKLGRRPEDWPLRAEAVLPWLVELPEPGVPGSGPPGDRLRFVVHARTQREAREKAKEDLGIAPHGRLPWRTRVVSITTWPGRIRPEGVRPDE